VAGNFQKIRNGVYFPGLAADPSSARSGDFYYNSVSNKFRYYNGTLWADIGSGSGGGDSSDIGVRLEARLELSSWRALTSNVFASDLATKVASSTGTIGADHYLLDAAENLISTQNLDAEFLAANVIPLSAEIQAVYDLTAVDPNPSIQLSRDGGASYQTVAATKQSGDDSWIGRIVFANTEPNQTVDDYNVSNADASVLMTDTGTGVQRAQVQTYTGTKVLKQITMYLIKTGSPVGNFRISLVRDSAGEPSTSGADYLISSAWQPISALSAGNNTSVIVLPSAIAVPAGTYWIVIETDSSYKATYNGVTTNIAVRVDASAPGKPAHHQYNGTVWAIASGAFVYLVEGYPLDLRFKVTSSAAATKLKGYGLFYDKGVDVSVGKSNRYEVTFDGATNPTNFDITNGGFLPDDKQLIVIWANTGQVFVHPIFDVNGYTVTFAAGQFLSTGTQRLIFWQPLGSSFDNAEKNAALLAANFLGSTDASIDRAVAGRGIQLKSPDGTRYEIVPQDGGTGLDFYEVT
jgi:hypothetical protein